MRTILIQPACYLVFLITVLTTMAPSQQGQNFGPRPLGSPGVKVYQFNNGSWFDGQGFQKRIFYSLNGLLTTKKPPTIDEVVDLHDGWVVPPFGDAHCHHFDNPRNIGNQVQMYLQEGVYYAMVQTDVRTGAEQVAAQVNTPMSVDVIYAHGGLTGSHSHPATGYEARALGYYGYKQERDHAAEIRASSVREGDAYYAIDTAPDLDRKWPLVVAGKPDFIKVYLLHSEQYDAHRRRTGEREGVDPRLLPAIVSRAHDSGLRVSAHVDSAADYRTALAAGVDMMAHLPGYFWINPEDDIHMYELSAADAAETARRHVLVIPTASLADNLPADRKSLGQANQIRSLRLLKAAGVEFGIGADSFGSSSRKEALYLSRLSVFSNLELLKLWCEVTPHAAFPQRKIGFLRDGFEASFLVLKENPLRDFGAVQEIAIRCKQGRLLAPADTH